MRRTGEGNGTLRVLVAVDGRRVEQADELILDRLRRRAGDLLRHDAAAQTAEGIDILGESFRGEDATVMIGHDGLEQWLDLDQMRTGFF